MNDFLSIAAMILFIIFVVFFTLVIIFKKGVSFYKKATRLLSFYFSFLVMSWSGGVLAIGFLVFPKVCEFSTNQLSTIPADSISNNVVRFLVECIPIWSLFSFLLIAVLVGFYGFKLNKEAVK